MCTMCIPKSKWVNFNRALYYPAKAIDDSKHYKNRSGSLCFSTIGQAACLSTNYGRTWRIPLEILSWGPSIFLPSTQHHQTLLDDYCYSGLCLMTTFCRNLKCCLTQVHCGQGPLLGPKEQHVKMNYTKGMSTPKEWNKLPSAFRNTC